MSPIDSEFEETVKQLAEESMDYIEPICQECWDEGKDDPLVNTPINKRINTLVDQLIKGNEEADEACRTELRDNLVEVFYQHRRWLFQGSSQKVQNTLECHYCYEERNADSEKLSVRVRNMDESDLFGKSQDEWR